MTPATPVIKHGDTDAKITFAADAAATLGEYKVQVFGHAEKGKDAEIEFKLNITAIDTFTLTGYPKSCYVGIMNLAKARTDSATVFAVSKK